MIARWHALLGTVLVLEIGGCSPRQLRSAPRDYPPAFTSVPALQEAPDLLAAPPDRVTGTVLDLQYHGPLAGRTVAIEGRTTLTDERGMFVVYAVAPTYDVAIVEPGGATATVYRGLSRRDPVLLHKRPPPKQYSGGDFHSELHGMLTGGGPYPLDTPDSVTVYVVGPGVHDLQYLGDWRLANHGPDFALYPSWAGPGSISGLLIALRSNGAPRLDGGGDAGRDGSPSSEFHKHWFGQRPVTLKHGETSTANLTLRPVSSKRFAVNVHSPRGHAPTLQSWYVLPSMRAAIETDGGCWLRDARRRYEPDTWWDCEVAEVPIPHAKLCVGDDSGSGDTLFAGWRCDAADAAVVSLTLQSPPVLTSPANLSAWSKEIRFAWTPFDHGIYRLELEVRWPTAETPSIDVYTAERAAIWPDLSAIGVSFPQHAAEYSVTIVGSGPYAQMDEATGAQGIGALDRIEWRAGTSSDCRVIVAPPPLADAGPTCEFPYMTALVCDTSSWPNETYMLAAINNHLRHFPQFAAAAGVGCVKDCAGARAYAKAYEEYSRQHPGFDANEPWDEPRAPAKAPSARPNDAGR